MTLALELDGVRGGYGSTEVVQGVSLRIEAGQIYSLIGKNGMGKSTLLKLIMGLLPARAGKISIGGEDVTGSRPDEIVARSISYVPQDQALFQDLTVEENLRLGSLRTDRTFFEQRKGAVCQLFPFLSERLRQRAGTLSGGEQKMLLLARALLPRPKLLLIDEVSEGVQPGIVARICDVLREERENTRVGVLLIEQNIEFAFSLADRFGVLNQGLIVDDGDPRIEGARGRAEAHLTI